MSTHAIVMAAAKWADYVNARDAVVVQQVNEAANNDGVLGELETLERKEHEAAGSS
jgi:hypothetical protein